DVQTGRLVSLPPRRLGARPHSYAMRNAVEPVAHQVPSADRAGASNENEERRLKRVFDVVLIVEDAPANSQNHRSVPLDQSREGSIVTSLDKTLKQLSLGQPRDCAVVENTIQLLQYGSGGSAQVQRASRCLCCGPLFLYLLLAAESNLTFSVFVKQW